MKVLVLAPHPFYQERGTPIAVDLLIRTLIERGDQVELLTLHEGEDRHYAGLRIHRIRPLPALRDIRPGFSLKKLYCDVFLFAKFAGLVLRNRYDIVHAVEESAFMAMFAGMFRRLPFVYDMDSSLSAQLVDRMPFLRAVRGGLRFLESLPIRRAAAVVPVCDALADEARRYRRDNVVLLKDVSLRGVEAGDGDAPDLRGELGVTGALVMYIGNLEPYQGMGLLLEGFADHLARGGDATLVVIGGVAAHVERYREMAGALGIGDRVRFTGPRPVSRIGQYMAQADVLVSPRIQGSNTPMKVYSYLDSGVPVLATRLPTHTQVMHDGIALLAEPDRAGIADGLARLLSDHELRGRLARAAREYIRREHSLEAFRERVFGLYAELEGMIAGARRNV